MSSSKSSLKPGLGLTKGRDFGAAAAIPRTIIAPVRKRRGAPPINPNPRSGDLHITFLFRGGNGERNGMMEGARGRRKRPEIKINK